MQTIINRLGTLTETDKLRKRERDTEIEIGRDKIKTEREIFKYLTKIF